ncbi:macrolide 2'-phosphotransferase [Thalassorhabdus alkalitolerans]|uniref:Macrolide 2'-phosphotransferase n=1 Tax=Thalassorhabdus alkalitolerans TaxID=2282697 RepID=A0ABW0YKD2_9BACI
MNKIKEITESAKRNGIIIEEDSVKINESGLDFQVVHATDQKGDRWILRLPRRDDSMAKTEVEKQVLDLVSRTVAFEVPVWTVYTDAMIAYKQLSGIPAGTVDPEIQNYVWEFDEHNVPENYINSLGKVLAELHQVPTESIHVQGLKVQSVDEARDAMKKRMINVKEKYGVGKDLWKRWQAWVDNDKIWPQQTGLLHGDVHAGHTLINEQAEVTGLIDWTEAAITDVSKDFVGPYMTHGEQALQQIITAYEKAGGITWPLMKDHIIEYEAASAIDLAEFAESSGSKEYEQMAKESLSVEK